jgi:ABC-type branched-subunit amino acid transport system ATPase component
MNAVGGFVPSTGEVHLLGHPAGQKSPAQRARLGLGRAFQNADLFGDLTVLETIALALERNRPTSLLRVLSGAPGWRATDRAQRAEAAELAHFMGLARYIDHKTSTLSTGTRRITELACLLALGPRLLCLDEPTAGVAQRETEAFGPLLLRIRAELGASMLVIEHDMPLIMSISDRVYCLEAGKVIAEGAPDDVRANARVIASYLGADERAIQRSDIVRGQDPTSP